MIRQIRNQLQGVRKSSALTAADILGFPDALKRFLLWIAIERAVTCEKAAGYLGETEKDTRSLILELAEHGLIEHVPTCGVPVYRVCLNPRRLRVPVELLETIDE